MTAYIYAVVIYQIAMADSGEGDAQATATQQVVEVSTFANYLRRVVPVLLEDADDTPETLIHALKDKASIDCIKKFLSDPQVPALAVHRLSSKGTSHIPSVCLSVCLCVCVSVCLSVCTGYSF